MEDVLEVYTWPDREDVRIICMDELSTQLLDDTHAPIPAQPGQCQRQDHEYVRHGTANIFLAFEPLRGQRFTDVTEQRTRVDWAHWVQHLVDVRYPSVELIVLVMDNLNVHSLASLYEAFPPAEAKRLAMKLEIHYTPKHGSWLNMAEIEASVLRRQCLHERRIPDRANARTSVIARPLPTSCWPGNNGAIATRPPSIGASPWTTHASNSSDSIHQFSLDSLLN